MINSSLFTPNETKAVMIRIPPTTLSLTISEVKEFECRFRFKKYLAEEDALGQLPIRPKSKAATIEKSNDSAYKDAKQLTTELLSRDLSLEEIEESIRLLACPPHRLPKSKVDPARNTPQDMPSSSQSGTSSSSNALHGPNLGGLPVSLPPPFSRETRSVSDAQSLPSSRYGIRARPRRGGADQDSPATPPRRSSLRGVHIDIRSSSPPRRDRRRLVSSAVRFVEPLAQSPDHDSPPSSSSPQVASSGSATPIRDSELESTSDTEFNFRVYDDSLPASSQPQTPHNLPEARHQSRLHGSYTAPLPRLARSTYRAASREITLNPSDIDTPAFRNLYHEREHTEDSDSFYEAPRFQEDESGEDEQH